VFATLYADGGIARFYKGFGVALISSPIARFGDTAANEGVKEFFVGTTYTQGIISMAAAIAAGSWRIMITPLTTMKTMLQVHGTAAPLWAKVAANGPGAMFEGCIGAATATAVAFYPWSFTFETVDKRLPEARSPCGKLARRAATGLIASFVSDVCSNSIRVLTAYKQSSEVPVGYLEAATTIIAADGVKGLFLRGLGIKLVSNGIQAMLFMILWKHLMEWWKERQSGGDPALATKTSPKNGRGGGGNGRGCSRISRPHMLEACVGMLGFVLLIWGLLYVKPYWEPQ